MNINERNMNMTFRFTVSNTVCVQLNYYMDCVFIDVLKVIMKAKLRWSLCGIPE